MCGPLRVVHSNSGPMQSAGCIYFCGGGGGGGGERRALHYSTCCNYTCKLYIMLSDVHLRAYKYVGLTLNCVHCGPCFMYGAGLWAAVIAGHCGIQLLQANAKCGPYEFQC